MASSRRPMQAVALVGAIALVMFLPLRPSAAWGEGFVPDVPDSPLSIEGIVLFALGDEASAVPGDAVSIARFVPMRLAVACDPASAQIGVDCGMEDMCGLDPCLCGSSDAWGRCSCNGLEERVPTIECVSADPDVVVVEERGGWLELRATGEGEAIVEVKARLENHDEAAARFVVVSEGLRAADWTLVGIACGAGAAIVAAFALIAALVHRHRTRMLAAVDAERGRGEGDGKDA